MAAWMSPSTGNQCTQTSTWTSTPAIHPRSRGDWLSACSTEQLAEGETPSYQSPEAERVPHCLHPLLFQPPQTGHGGNWDTTTGRRAQTPTGDAPLHRRGQWGCQTGLQKVWHEGCLQVWTVLPLHSNQSEGPPDDGEASQGGVSHPMQLWRGLHWRDSEKTGGQSEGAQGCMSEGSTGKVSIGRACMDRSPSNHMEGSLRDWPGQDGQRAASEKAIHIRLNHPSLNRDGGLELPRCWMAALKDTKSGPNQGLAAPTHSSSNSTWWDARLYNDKCSH